MSSQPENRFIQSLHRLLPRTLHHEKMHNMYRGGTADVWYDGLDDLWIEYKYLPRQPQRGNVVANLSELQKQWLRGRYDNGRAVAVIVGCPKGGVVLCRLEWEAALTADQFNARLQDKKSLAAWISQITGGVHNGNSIRKGYLSED